MISMIVATDKHNIIGIDGSMPWHIPSDLKYFKEYTKGKTVVMGRKTYESMLPYFPEGKEVLPGRKKIVLSTNDVTLPFSHIINTNGMNVVQIIKEIESVSKDFCVIGGGLIYKLFIDYTEELSLTEINTIVDIPENAKVITKFPFSKNKWIEKNRIKGQKTEHDQFDFDFVIYQKKILDF